ncbi:MAG: hypothetical protein U9532_01140 ['Conium maculatum' witches'-broom phytoplasma]|nr:hypothetical protein ['Conium maculatum' witches'-broom phytoplasma]
MAIMVEAKVQEYKDAIETMVDAAVLSAQIKALNDNKALKVAEYLKFAK